MRKKGQENINLLAKEVEKQSASLYDFEVLLDNAKKIDEKQRLLWKQIYRNAVDDRSSAAVLFEKAYATMGNQSTDHIALGATLVRYLEKMSKSNQQLLELSSLITQGEEESMKINPDDIFRQIEGKNE